MIQYGKKITSTSYYDGAPISTKEEVEVSVLSSRESILKDVIEAMGVISRCETHKLTIEVEINSKGKYRLIKKWSCNADNY